MRVAPPELLSLAERAALAGGRVLAERFREPAVGLATKSTPTDLVSDADRASEETIVGMIRAERPRDAVVAEEGDGHLGDSGVRWLVDPLDGTTNFLWGIPQWCVSVAAQDAEGGLAAVVHDPLRGETFRAARGEGAWLDGTRLRVRPAPPLGEALVGTGFNYASAERARQAERLRRLLPLVRDLRRLGAAALDLAWVAAGRVDGYFETGLAPWDWAAGDLLVREAGGILERRPGDGEGPETVLAGSPELVGALVRVLEAG